MTIGCGSNTLHHAFRALSKQASKLAVQRKTGNNFQELSRMCDWIDLLGGPSSTPSPCISAAISSEGPCINFSLPDSWFCPYVFTPSLRTLAPFSVTGASLIRSSSPWSHGSPQSAGSRCHWKPLSNKAGKPAKSPLSTGQWLAQLACRGTGQLYLEPTHTRLIHQNRELLWLHLGM